MIQLVATGVQNVHLNANPQITFWKTVFRRYTNFAEETVEQIFNGQVAFGRTLTLLTSRNGDLVHRCWFTFTLPAIEPDVCQGSTAVYWTNSIGHALIRKVSVQVGGQAIDTQYGEWMALWNEALLPVGLHIEEMVGRRNTVRQLIEDAKCPKTYIVPMLFWFCRNPGLALPLIALQYHEVRWEFELRALEQCWVSRGNPRATPIKRGTCTPLSENDLSGCLYVDYVYLDGLERARFAQSSHEYLIQQLQTTLTQQFQGGSLGSITLKVLSCSLAPRLTDV